MASIFKAFNNNDIISNRTPLYENVPITGSIVSGAYADLNIKNYSHGQFQSVFDYPHLSASSNHIFDISAGYHNSSVLSASTNTQNVQKINIYNQMAQVLMGYSTSGTIQLFDEDGDILAGGTKMRECFFINFSRLLTKDEIKKGSFSLVLGAYDQYETNGNVFDTLLTITDAGAQNDYRVNSPAGEYGILSASVAGAYSASYGATTLNGLCGLIFYQAGVAVLSGSVFENTTGSNGKLRVAAQMNSAGDSVNTLLKTTSISGAADALRHRVHNISFNNTTELNSTIYFCRLNNNEFNYSSNQTYLSASKLVVKNNSLDAPVTYITTIGGYSADNELIWVAKLSEPIKKDPSIELNFRVRHDW